MSPYLLMVRLGTQVIRYIQRIQIIRMVINIARVMNSRFSITKPSNPNANIIFVFTSTDNNYIPLFCKPKFCSFFRSNKCTCLISFHAIVSIHIPIVNTGIAIFHNIITHKSPASCKGAFIIQFS